MEDPVVPQSPPDIVEPEGNDAFLKVSSDLELLELLGEGGKGKVFRARHRRLDRLVAVKVMLPHLIGDAENLQRFKQEKVFCGSLSHPGIVTTYYSGITDGGIPFLVMDLLVGETLAAHIARNRLDRDRFFILFKQIIDALIYLHEEGVVHRDLKPSNIFITRDSAGCENAVIIDFGLSQILDADAREGNERITRTGAVIGTSLYMSPEQCRAEKLDARTDIYALGCVMFEALTGSPPFVGDSTYEVMFKQLNNSLSGLDALKKLPSSLAKLLALCLQKDASNRYQTVAELKEAFLQGADDSPLEVAMSILAEWFKTGPPPQQPDPYLFAADTALECKQPAMAQTYASKALELSTSAMQRLMARTLLSRAYAGTLDYRKAKGEINSALAEAKDIPNWNKEKIKAICHEAQLEILDSQVLLADCYWKELLPFRYALQN